MIFIKEGKLTSTQSKISLNQAIASQITCVLMKRSNQEIEYFMARPVWKPTDR